MADEREDARRPEQGLTRSDLLKRAGAGAAAAGLAGTVGVEKAYSFAGPLKYKGRWLKNELKILQWVHFVPAYDKWFDNEWVKTWGEKNDTDVKVDHVNNQELPSRAASEVAAQQGHDLFQFLSPPPAYEDQVINHAPIVQEVSKKLGKMGQLGYKSSYNPKTKKYYGFPDNYVPDPVVWRHDLWNDVGESPASWDHVLKAAPKLKAAGHPIGIGMSNEIDSNMANMALMMCFGSFVQNEEHRCTINSKQTVEVLKFMQSLYKAGMTNEVFGWNPASNNQFLYSGKGSLILNAISATRTPEALNLPFSDNLWIWPIPKGPSQRMGLEHVMGVYVIWKFAKNKAGAQRYLADQALNYRQHFINSQFYNFPIWAKAVPDIKKLTAADTHKPKGKYTVLNTIAARYTTNVGHPGFANAAIDEIFNTFLVPQMFAQVAQDKLSAADAARAAQRQMNAIFGKWRAQGKI
jgi:multiple sugar transport system substrate-binding protein